MATLQDFPSIQTNLFIRIPIEYYVDAPGAAPGLTILTFTDRLEAYSLFDEPYEGLGGLLGITASTSEIRPSSGELTITISGIPNSSMYSIINSRILGSQVTVYRGLFDAETQQPLNVDNQTLVKYRGFINNYSLQEEWDPISRTSSNTIVIICNSVIDVLQNKISGRRTNPSSMKKYFPNDISFDRVPTLENATFDFGAPK